MPSTQTWTPERVAKRVRSLADEHGAPNRFQLHEIAGDTNRAAVLAISRVARLQRWSVNQQLAVAKLSAEYQVRQGPCAPAYVVVTAT